MGQTNINIRIDENLKKQFDALCNELGMSMTTAINMFAKAMIRHSGLPFEVSLHVPNEETRQALEDVNNGIGLSKTYHDVEKLFEDLDA